MELGISGLASGFDWRTLVDQLSDVERSPQRRLLSEQGRLTQQLNAYNSIRTQLAVLQNRVNALKEPSLFQSRKVATSSPTIGSATALPGATLGRYDIEVSQLASASRWRGASDIASPLNPTNDVSALVLSTAPFSTAVTSGTLTLNGQTFTVDATQTLQDLFDQISAATDGAVSASYDSATDLISLSSAGPIVLGGAADTSNFFQAARLSSNGSGNISSSARLGAMPMGVSLADAPLKTALSDGGSGEGKFKINGVEISFSASTDSLSKVLDRVNSSGAGVNAAYDSGADRLVLTNKITGDLGVGLEDVTGNFLAATGLLDGALSRGNDLLYRVNDGEILNSSSNTVSLEASGIPGLSITALGEGSFQVSVETDSSAIGTAISNFLADYNKVQSAIDSNTASSTDSKGKVTSGILTGDRAAASISSSLRSLAYAPASSLPETLRHLAHIGIESNGSDDSLKLADEARLTAALSSNTDAVANLFTDPDEGIATRLSAFLNRTIGDEGSLRDRELAVGRQSAAIDSQIQDLERIVQSNRARLIDGFVAMETAQAKMNQQLQFLVQRFNS